MHMSRTRAYATPCYSITECIPLEMHTQRHMRIARPGHPHISRIFWRRLPSACAAGSAQVDPIAVVDNMGVALSSRTGLIWARLGLVFALEHGIVRQANSCKLKGRSLRLLHFRCLRGYERKVSKGKLLPLCSVPQQWAFSGPQSSIFQGASTK